MSKIDTTTGINSEATGYSSSGDTADNRHSTTQPVAVSASSEAVIDGIALLDDVAGFIGRFVRFPSPAHLDAVTLWVVHCHALDAFDTTPRLALLSAEKQSGKTRTLEVLALLVPNARHSLNISAAAMFRLVQKVKPTLLFDEVDTIFGPRAKDHEDVRGLLNAGHRRGATVSRCVGEGTKIQVQDFPVFAAVALAGIGDLPDTIHDRSIVVRLKRRALDERVEAFRWRTAQHDGDLLKAVLAGWAEQNLDRLRHAVPQMPDGVTDRAADTWEPLLAIADAAGGSWPQRARVAAVELLASAVADDGSLGLRLLTDTRELFVAKGWTVISSADLATELADIEDAPWGDHHGRRLDPRGLARLLRPFDIRPHGVRIGSRTPKGYSRAEFEDAWRRYLPAPDSVRHTATLDEPDAELPNGSKGISPVADVALRSEAREIAADGASRDGWEDLV